MKTFLRLLVNQTLFDFDRERSHVVLSIGYGTYLWAAQSFNGASPNFRGMDRMARVAAPGLDAEAVWGSLMIISGGLGLLGLLTARVRLRRSAALLLAALWALMAVSFFQSNPHSPACFTYTVLAWSSFSRAVQIGRANPAPAAVPCA